MCGKRRQCTTIGTISTRKHITDPLFYIIPKVQAINLKILDRHLDGGKSSVYTEVIGVTKPIETKFHVGVFIKTYFFGYRRHLALLSITVSMTL